MTKINKNDWRPVATTDSSLTTTDVLLTTTGDHWRPSADGYPMFGFGS